MPRDRAADARVLGVPNERFLLTRDGLAAMDAEFTAARLRARDAREASGSPAPARAQLLAVSGGGEDGAFGAGLLTGWSAAGTRPEFSLVTGVSTGALTAPFAYLGPTWDDALRAVYTEITMKDVAISRGLVAAITHDAMADTSPLFGTISRHLDARMLAALAAAYRSGRLLLVGTTNLDTQRGVIWNIGAIAASGHPGALDLVRRLLLASAAIPGAFPPVMIDVELDGHAHQEMHVDGGAIAQVFLYPPVLTAGRREELHAGRPVSPIDAYVIRNARLDPTGDPVERRTVSIAGRAVTTMLATSGTNDVNRIWMNAERDGIDFHLAYIGADFTTPWPAPFDQAYMRALYAYGFDKARSGLAWHSLPPWAEIAPVRSGDGGRRTGRG